MLRLEGKQVERRECAIMSGFLISESSVNVQERPSGLKKLALVSKGMVLFIR